MATLKVVKTRNFEEDGDVELRSVLADVAQELVGNGLGLGFPDPLPRGPFPRQRR